MEDYYWRTENPTVFLIGGEKINIDKRGAAYAEQFGRLTAWLSTHALTALFSAHEAGILDGGSEYDTAVGMISYLMSSGVTPDAMVELGAILLGTSNEFAEENFDPGWLVDALITLIDTKPGLKNAFVRVFERFFLADGRVGGGSDSED